MLVYLHVKNLALIEEEEIAFKKGLNILSGETGAGKSIILGALSLALGGKIPKDFLRNSESEGLVEAAFTITDDKLRRKLSQMDIDTYDDEIILSRKVSESRSVAKINGETVPAQKMQEIGEFLIDIYGQHEHQSLLKKSVHLDMLDEYGKEEIYDLKLKVKELYERYSTLLKDYNNGSIDDAKRMREISFLQHEIEEIESAALKPDEDESVEAEYELLKNNQKIMEALSEGYRYTGDINSASDLISRALSRVQSVAEYDSKIEELASTLNDVDSILSDFNRDLSTYMSDAEFDEGHFYKLERRLNLINELKMKYGRTIEDINSSLAEKKERLEKLLSYDDYLNNLESELNEAKDALNETSIMLSDTRKKFALPLSKEVKDSLIALNFLNVNFEMEFNTLDDFSSNGIDDAEFIISTNPGEPMRKLKDIASGGEMSRIMLAFKTVLARKDDIDTLIFDEIDAGISGRTAQAVSEKLSEVAREHQVICITHLPQIAAMADTHFRIEKSVQGSSTISTIEPLTEEESIEELARMLGGAEITEAVINNAREMKSLANNKKA